MRTKPIKECDHILGLGDVVQVQVAEGKWQRGILNGRFSMDDGVVTHLWVNTLDGPTDSGYHLNDIRLVLMGD